MAYGIVHFFPGGTREQYEAALTEVHPSRSSLPRGQTYHAAGPTDGGWLVVAIFETKKDWESFRDGILMPKLGAGIPGAFAGPPREQAFEVYNLQKG